MLAGKSDTANKRNASRNGVFARACTLCYAFGMSDLDRLILSRSQLLVLRGAARRASGCACPTARLRGAPQTAVLGALMDRGLVTREAAPRITLKGYGAIARYDWIDCAPSGDPLVAVASRPLPGLYKNIDRICALRPLSALAR